ncbi:hypothetical protein GGR56DRAFT_666697 [Xylariaceae sp. FL0804]|nr:hypothetical protein GGR56DRAFT_666697 [Xylariaceae sp. FL0804]
MEKKRKLPARAAARVEHVSKKRTSTPPERSLTPVPPANDVKPVDSQPDEPPPLPKSLQPGHPLPTVENAQPEDLSAREYQSVQESGVLAESLSRSRQKWTHEGIFEKYWTRPFKRKGVVREEPNNPPKESMTKIGPVTIIVEPHHLEATMYAVKDPKPAAPTTTSAFRPIIQYGPPNGVMPPPPPPKPSAPSSPAAAAAAPATPSTPQAQSQPPPHQSPQPVSLQQQQPQQQQQEEQGPRQRQQQQQQQQQQGQGQGQEQEQQLLPPPPPPPLPPPSAPTAAPGPTQLQTPQTQPPMAQPQSMSPSESRRPSSSVNPGQPLASPRGLESVLAAPQPSPAAAPFTAPPQPQPLPLSNGPPHPPPPVNRPLYAPNPTAVPSVPSPVIPSAKPAVAAAKPGTPTAAGADPIIVTLAEKASEDPHLRDLMKRVAVGEAAPNELAHFQRIIDQITNEYKKKGGQQGPSADRLAVEGRTVKYFADEVRTILDIVLNSNPQQRSSDLRSPPGSDPLVILLVKEALDKSFTRDIVRRIAEGKPKFADALELKSVLDKLAKEAAKSQQAAGGGSQVAQSPANGLEDHGVVPNGAGSRKPSVSGPPQPQTPSASQQALRSKGPPPSSKPDIAAIVFEFTGGAGDRYRFPKYSILEYSPNQVIASFLIVRKGSNLEYGGEPTLDYYQPVTIRLHSHSSKHLENLARVVAPQDEVQRYMDDVMTNMTRAEYVLLAMRLPREEDEQADDRSETPKADTSLRNQQTSVLWTAKPAPVVAPPKGLARPAGEEDQYMKFIASVS